MTEIKWEDPPAAEGRGKYKSVAAELRQNPYRWALISEEANPGLVSNINRGHHGSFAPAGSFEARGSMVGDRRVKVWARYVGGDA